MITGYKERYFSEFKADSYPELSKIGAGSYYRVEFHFRGYNGQASELLGAETTITLSQDDKWIGIKTTEAKISLVVQNNTTLQSFYVDDDRQVLVVLRKEINSTTYQNIFYGWLTPWDATEPYMRAPYQIDLTATCGLGSLQDFEYDYLPGIHTVHNILYNCLVKVGYELPLHQASYIYEESQLINGNLPNLEIDAFFTTKINTQGFIENGKRKSCYDILADFCEANYVLCQDGGVWKLVRREHQIDFAGQFTYLRYQDAADYNPTTIITDIRKDVFFDDDLVPLYGSNLGIQQSVKIVEVNANYGELTNQLQNGYFIFGLNAWQLNPIGFAPPSTFGDGTDDNPFGISIPGNAYEVVAKVNKNMRTLAYLSYHFSLYQTVSINRAVKTVTFADPTVAYKEWNIQDQYLTLSIDYVNRNCAGPLILLKVSTSKGEYLLDQNGKWIKDISVAALQQDNTYKDVNTNTQQAKPTLGETFTITAIEPVPGIGSYTISLYLYQGISLPDPRSNAIIEYRRAWITIEDRATIVPIKEVITIQEQGLDARARKRKEAVTLHFVDQTSTLAGANIRYGALLRVNDTPTQRWASFINGTLQFGKWQAIVAKGIYRLQGKQAVLFDGEVLGEPSPLELLRFPELDNKLMMPTQWEWNVNRRTTRVRAIELLNVIGNTKSTGSWRSEDGTSLPMPEGTADLSDPQKPAVVLPTRSMGIMTALQNSIGLLVPNTAMQVPKDYVSTSKAVTSIRNSLTNAIIRYGGK